MPEDEKTLINEIRRAIQYCDDSIIILESRTKQFEFFKNWDNTRIRSKELKKKWMKSNQRVLDNLGIRKKEFNRDKQKLRRMLEQLGY